MQFRILLKLFFNVIFKQNNVFEPKSKDNRYSQSSVSIIEMRVMTVQTQTALYNNYITKINLLLFCKGKRIKHSLVNIPKLFTRIAAFLYREFYLTSAL